MTEDTRGIGEANAEAHIRLVFERSIALKQEVAAKHLSILASIASLIGRAVCVGNKVLLCGNGGSAADAQHLAAEMLVRLRPHVNREAIPALSLNADMSSITACANDYSFELYFERMIRALGARGDVLIALSTSGRSANVIRALRVARDCGLSTVGFLGADGGDAAGLCDLALIVPSEETGRVQEIHITAGHAVLEVVEESWLRHHT